MSDRYADIRTHAAIICKLHGAEALVSVRSGDLQALLAERDRLREALESCLRLIDLTIPFEGDVTRKARAALQGELES